MIINDIEDLVKLAREKGICKDGNNIIQDDYKFIQNEIDKLIKENSPYSIFTAIDGQGKDINIVNGFWRINRLGYIVIKLSDVTIPEEGLPY